MPENSFSSSRQILAGDHTTLGANWDGEGTNFALFSAYASRVELCLFDESGNEAYHPARIYQ
jgi:isoamylase